MTQPFPNGPLPYAGPGIEGAAGVTPGALNSFSAQLQALMSTTAGSGAASIVNYAEGVDAEVKPRGLYAEDYLGAGQTGMNRNGNSFMLDPVICPGTVSYYNFSDPNCFPLAFTSAQLNAAVAPAPIVTPSATVLYDLAQKGRNATGMGRGVTGTVIPAGMTAATAAALKYAPTPDKIGTGILFDNTVNGSVQQFLNLNGSAMTYNMPLVPVGTKRALFCTAIMTPAGYTPPAGALNLIATFGGIGGVAGTAPQAAFAINHTGNFVAYCGPGASGKGGMEIVSDSPAAANTRYCLGILYEADPFDPTIYWTTFYVNGISQGYAMANAVPNLTPTDVYGALYNGTASVRVPDYFPDNQTPWTVPGTPSAELTQGDASTVGFGGLAAWTGSTTWSFYALGSMVVNLDMTTAYHKLLMSQFGSDLFIGTTI